MWVGGLAAVGGGGDWMYMRSNDCILFRISLMVV